MLWEADVSEVWTGPKGDDGTSDLNTGRRFNQPAGHGPLHTDENHVIIPHTKMRDNNTYRFLQLSGIRGGGIRGQILSDI